MIGSEHDRLDEKQIMLLLTEVIEKVKKQNQELVSKQADAQVIVMLDYCPNTNAVSFLLHFLYLLNAEFVVLQLTA